MIFSAISIGHPVTHRRRLFGRRHAKYYITVITVIIVFIYGAKFHAVKMATVAATKIAPPRTPANEPVADDS
jgi:hypothetical protein